jgi:hypothetical protein
MARIAESTRTLSGGDPITTDVREYKRLRSQIDLLTKQQKKIRDTLMQAIEEHGEPDDQGSLWLTLKEDADGTLEIKRQRRVSRSLDEGQAASILKDNDLWEQCTKTIVVVDEDAVMQALFDDELSEDDVDAIYPSKISWALEVK